MHAPGKALWLAALAFGGAPLIAQTPSPPYSAAGLYNLANSYARAGQPGRAVLEYERAALLAPGDPDIAANLDHVRALAHVDSEPHDRIVRLLELIGPTVAAWIGVAGLALAGIALLAVRAMPQRRWIGAGVLPFGLALMALAGSNAAVMWPRMHEAVVLVSDTPARVSPVPMAETAFVLRETETVTMTAVHDEFVLVRTRRGRSGWVARGQLGAVVPVPRDAAPP